MRPRTLTAILLGIACIGLGRSGETKPKAGTKPGTSYQVVHGWPTLPEGFSFGHATGVAVDSHNHVWVYHRGGIKPIMAFDGKTGQLVTAFGEGVFKRAHGLRVDREDHIWVTDKDQHLIYKFSHDGKVLMTVGTKDQAGEDGTHFNGVADLAILPGGDFYVADGYQNNRVAKFSKEGKFLFAWGSKGDKPGQFNVPHGIAVDAEGRVYVADRSNRRVQVFDGEGTYLSEWKNDAIGRPWGMTVGPDGFLYLVDGGDAFLQQNKQDTNPHALDRSRIVKMTLDGKIVTTIGRYGRYNGEFIWAHGVAVGQDGAVYVSDVHTGMRIQKFVAR
jgi:peptidylamidoglycolate lyase